MTDLTVVTTPDLSRILENIASEGGIEQAVPALLGRVDRREKRGNNVHAECSVLPSILAGLGSEAVPAIYSWLNDGRKSITSRFVAKDSLRKLGDAASLVKFLEENLIGTDWSSEENYDLAASIFEALAQLEARSFQPRLQHLLDVAAKSDFPVFEFLFTADRITAKMLGLTVPTATKPSQGTVLRIHAVCPANRLA